METVIRDTNSNTAEEDTISVPVALLQNTLGFRGDVEGLDFDKNNGVLTIKMADV